MRIFKQQLMDGIVRLGGTALLLISLGCVVDRNIIHLRIRHRLLFTKESPAQFKETGGWTVAQPADAKLRGKWWEIFNDAETERS